MAFTADFFMLRALFLNVFVKNDSFDGKKYKKDLDELGSL